MTNSTTKFTKKVERQGRRLKLQGSRTSVFASRRWCIGISSPLYTVLLTVMCSFLWDCSRLSIQKFYILVVEYMHILVVWYVVF
jgi:hypothetical protein